MAEKNIKAYEEARKDLNMSTVVLSKDNMCKYQKVHLCINGYNLVISRGVPVELTDVELSMLKDRGIAYATA